MINQDFESIRRRVTHHRLRVQEKIIAEGNRLFQILMDGYALGKRRVEATWAHAKHNISHLLNTYRPRIKRNIFLHITTLTAHLRTAWRRWKPSVDRFVQASIAISTGGAALNLSIQIAPIIFSVLSVLATAPLISAIVPGFLLYKSSIFLILIGISIFAGYNKYRELVDRAQLDNQIRINEEKIEKLSAELEEIKRIYTPQYSHRPESSAAPAPIPPQNGHLLTHRPTPP